MQIMQHAASPAHSIQHSALQKLPVAVESVALVLVLGDQARFVTAVCGVRLRLDLKKHEVVLKK
jgi:hypothetical protein